jgi:hypothetical protein
VRRGRPRYLGEIRGQRTYLLQQFLGMAMLSRYLTRMGTIRVAALGAMVVIVGVIWYIRH